MNDRDHTITAWYQLISRQPGLTQADAAHTLGITKGALEKAIARARADGDPRIPAKRWTPRPDNCRQCGQPMVPADTPKPPGHVRHHAYGYCATCAARDPLQPIMPGPVTEPEPEPEPEPNGWGPDLTPHALRLHAHDLEKDDQPVLAHRFHRLADQTDPQTAEEAA